MRGRQDGSADKLGTSPQVTGSGPDRKVGRSRVADQIVNDLRQRIFSGELPNGARLPAERELADQYGVSGATIREAVRVLATVGLVNVRHGAGSFVAAELDTMIGMSIASVVGLAGVGAGAVLGVLGALNRYAVQLAASEATDAEIASLREAAEKLALIDNTDRTVQDLRNFMRRLVEISHNALLIPLCRILSDIQVDLAVEMSGGRVAEWRRVAGGVHVDRLAVVGAIERRCAEQAAEAADQLAANTISLVLSTPQAKRLQLSDPDYARLLVGMFNARLGLAAA